MTCPTPLLRPLVLVTVLVWSCTGKDSGPPSGGHADAASAEPEETPGPIGTHQCIQVEPAMLNFGGVLPGQRMVLPLAIGNCGDTPLLLYDIGMAEGSSPEFDVVPYLFDEQPTMVAWPIQVGPLKKVEVSVLYRPMESSAWGVEGKMVLAEGILRIDSNDKTSPTEVPTSGAGITDCCLTAVAAVEEGNSVLPGTTVHLLDNSLKCYYTPAVVRWDWEVQRPLGSMSEFVPSNDVPNPSFELDVFGPYTFYLTIYDELGSPSCGSGKASVLAAPETELRVELTWHMPEDMDETDTGPEAGSDLDLHFLHPKAAGPDLDGDGAPDGWFDMPYDCFWFNAHPVWGDDAEGLADPSFMSVDDTDGGGPEVVDLIMPGAPKHRVGVHYWNDHGYGAAYATVRVFVQEDLVFEVTDVMLVDSDLWEVCIIEWPSGKVQPVVDEAGQHKIVPDYHNPYFFQ